MTKRPRAIVINEKDNVATALKRLQAGAEIFVEIRGNIQKIKILSDIPMGHKVALEEIQEGEPVIKYGETMGQGIRRIVPGEHVHIHNVTSRPREGLS